VGQGCSDNMRRRTDGMQAAAVRAQGRRGAGRRTAAREAGAGRARRAAAATPDPQALAAASGSAPICRMSESASKDGHHSAIRPSATRAITVFRTATCLPDGGTPM
jgi:hypothetical protein